MPSTKLLITAQAFMDAYKSWDLEKLMSLRSADCVQRIFPQNLPVPARNNDDFREYFQSIQSIFKDWETETLETIVDATAHKVVIHGICKASTIIGPFTNEVMFVLKMTEDDALIKDIKEFVDSAASRDFFIRLRETQNRES
ncbi:hypothetical protein JX266_006832 [Neoarthrinium moseri]|nr:hypothetical protein JX266_006832 [Neoarthrinium moseri]